MLQQPTRAPLVHVCLAAAAAAAILAGCGGDDATGPDPDPTPQPPAVTSVTVDAPATEIESGATLQLSAEVLPATAPQTVTWSSSQESIATVSGAGLVTGTGPGTATIRATSTADASKRDEVDITVICELLQPADVAGGADLPAHTCYIVESPLSVNEGTLAIAEGVDLMFEPNAHLRIASGGSMHAIGTADAPVRLTSADPAGAWRGVQFDGSRSPSNVLDHVIIENGGSSGWSGAAYSRSAVLLEGDALVEIRNSTISGSGGQGITAYGGSEVVFEDNTLSGNAVAAWMHPGNAGSISATTAFDGNTENVVRVAFTNTNAVQSDVSWPGLAVPYEVQRRFYVDARLTLEPGAVLAFVRDVPMIVRNAGSLTAVGTDSEPITFTSAEDLPGYWQGLQITTASAGNVFDHVVFENGGSQPWTGAGDSRAMVYLEGNSKAVFTNSTFRGSGHYGLWVPGGGDIAGFEGNRFTENARAMIVHPDRAGAIVPSNIIEGNTEDRIRVSFDNTNAVTSAQTWAHTGAPYRVMSRTYVRADLVLVEDVVVEFAQNVSFIVQEGGSLAVEGGDPEEDGPPVVFRGVEDLNGYWQGIRVATASALNRFRNARIANAGSSQWFGGGNSIAALYVDSNGTLDLDTVSFEKSGALAATVSGTLSCADVDDNGFGFHYWPGANASGCP